MLVTYKFDGVPEHTVLVRPHGNCKENKPYRRTMESTKKLLTTKLESQSPKTAVNSVYESKGGILKAGSAGKLPRNRNQAYYLKQKLQQQEITDSIGLGLSPKSTKGIHDMLYIVIEQCKKAEISDRFVQDVVCAPEPMAVLATEQQLINMERFCCDPYQFSIFGVDPTFNLGEFSVTPTVFKNVILEDTKTHSSPIVLGPLLVHYHKTFRTYNFFFSTLIGLRSSLKSVQAIGTDGEKALADALTENFPHAIHLRCFCHLQQNVESHLREKQFPSAVIRQYVKDIFGWRDHDTVYEGLVDSVDAQSFNSQLQQLQNEWDEREKLAFSDRVEHTPGFYTWFVANKSEDFCNHTLRGLREDVGLGSPPTPFFTNASESVNAVLKETVSYKKQQWPIFNNKVKKAVESQQGEMEKTIISSGQYRICQMYKFLVCSEDTWFRMTSSQRLVLIKKFNTCSVRVKNRAVSSTEQASSSSNTEEVAQGCVTVGNFSTCDDDNIISLSHKAIADTRVPQPVAEGIWKKAEMLVTEENAVVVAPGCGVKDKMVKSKSGSAPHLVKTTGNCDYKCDGSCMQFKSLNICSHVLAAAHVNGDTDGFIQWYRKNFGNRLPNLTQIASHGMPATAGRKGGKAPRKKTAPRPVLTSENRVPLQTIHIVNNSTAESQNNAITQTHAGVSSCTSPPYPSQPSFPMPLPIPPPPFMYNPHPYASHSYSNSQQLHQPHFQPYSGVGPAPPPQYAASTPEFTVCFKFGNVSVCSGCRQNFLHSEDVLIRHAEFRSYNSPVTGAMASKFGNAYYHPRFYCVTKKWPEFTAAQLCIPQEIMVHLTVFHKSLLAQEFGINF